MTLERKPTVILPLLLCVLVGVMCATALCVGVEVSHGGADRRLAALCVGVFILCCFALDAVLNAMRGNP